MVFGQESPVRVTCRMTTTIRVRSFEFSFPVGRRDRKMAFCGGTVCGAVETTISTRERLGSERMEVPPAVGGAIGTHRGDNMSVLCINMLPLDGSLRRGGLGWFPRRLPRCRPAWTRLRREPDEAKILTRVDFPRKSSPNPAARSSGPLAEGGGSGDSRQLAVPVGSRQTYLHIIL